MTKTTHKFSLRFFGLVLFFTFALLFGEFAHPERVFASGVFYEASSKQNKSGSKSNSGKSNSSNNTANSNKSNQSGSYSNSGKTGSNNSGNSNKSKGSGNTGYSDNSYNSKKSNYNNPAASAENTKYSQKDNLIPDKSLDLEELAIPRLTKEDIIIKHTGFTISYNEDHEQANWVAYVLTKDEASSYYAQRNENFREDEAVPTGSATLDDYRRSGYDRGHLAPAADFRWSTESMEDTFLLSNMSPQDHEFNKGIWNNLEMEVRRYAKRFRTICVVTGPVLTDGPYKTIGQNRVSVPKYYYKVILDYSEPELKAIGFIIPNEGSERDIYEFACSVDDVEKATGIDFFHLLDNKSEKELEGSFDVNKWK